MAGPFPEAYFFKAPLGFCATLATAASRNHTTGAEYIRRVLLAAFREDGLELPSTDFRALGEPFRGRLYTNASEAA